jgi:isoquinoline 1-oxidoreductase
MNAPLEIGRRDLFQLLGGGIVILFGMKAGVAAAQGRNPYPTDFHAYLSIGEDGKITVFSGKIEMGQGVLTSQAQMAAEELGADLSQIEMVLGDTDRCPWDAGTFGSLTTRVFGPALRAACARARAVLAKGAADELGTTPDKIVLRGGQAWAEGAPNRKIGFGALSKKLKIAETVDDKAVLRVVADFDVMGKSAPRIDAHDKVTGKAKYAADVRLPGMLYGRILRPPAHGATLIHVDTSAAKAAPGVTVVEKGALVAVLHKDPEAAGKALDLVKAEWTTPPAGPDQEGIFDHLVQRSGEGRDLVHKGDPASVQPARSFESAYHKGYVAHAPMEPHSALADVKADSATVWASTQGPFPLRDNLAKTLGMDPKKVRVLTPFVGGGFGGKTPSRQGIEAAQLSQACGKPVQVAWTRAEEFFYDTFDPAAVAQVKSGLDANGKIVSWDYTIMGAAPRGAAILYDIPNVRVRAAGGMSFNEEAEYGGLHAFAVGPWRAPGANMNIFAIESQIDQMAAASGVDPLEFRLNNLTDARARRVLQAAAEAFRYTPGKGPSGRGYGMALSLDAGAYVGTFAEVKVDKKTGQVRVVRMACAQDMGIVVNPEGAKQQIEGGLTMGLGYTLAEELRFKWGDIEDRNFGTYQLPRFSWAPEITSVLVKNDELAPQGGGEPAITTCGASIANAVFDATGARMTRLPMTRKRVLEALAAKPA